MKAIKKAFHWLVFGLAVFMVLFGLMFVMPGLLIAIACDKGFKEAKREFSLFLQEIAA